MRTKHLKLLGAAGATALTIGAIASPALAAGEESADVTYTCPTTLGLTPAPSAHYVVDAPPATLFAGQKASLPTTGTITIDTATSSALAAPPAAGGFGWVSFTAKIVTPTSGSQVGQNLTVAKSPMAAPGNPTTAPITGNTLVRPTKAGTFTLNLKNLGAASGLPAGAVTLQGFDAADAVLNSAIFPDGGAFGQCTNVAGSTPLQNATPAPATIAVAKDKSATATKASYNAKKDIATGTATVKGRFGLAGTGKVKFTLKKGTKTVKSITATLKKGKASAAFKKVKAKGKYSITAAYAGDAALKASSGKASFTVK